MIREWRGKLLAAGVSETMVAKAYRLLRAVLNTAVREDELIRANPCRVTGADREEPAERPVLTVAEVFALAEQMPPRYRAMVLVTTFGCLRWGEVSALQRRDIDLAAPAIEVRQAFGEHRGIGLVLGPPKSRAGLRKVAVPAVIVPQLRVHLGEFVGSEPAALVFAGPTGQPIWRGNFNKLVKWPDAVAAIGHPGLHFHDLRHTGNTLAAQTGPSLRDLMARMGHDDPRAALIYQHATSEADQAIAKRINAAVKKQRSKRGRVPRTLEAGDSALRDSGATHLAEDQADALDGGADR